MSLGDPDDWSDEQVWKLARAIEEHRLSRVDLFYWHELDVRGVRPHDVAREMMLTVPEVLQRVEKARKQIGATFERPTQEPYLGRWIERKE